MSRLSLRVGALAILGMSFLLAGCGSSGEGTILGNETEREPGSRDTQGGGSAGGGELREPLLAQFGPGGKPIQLASAFTSDMGPLAFGEQASGRASTVGGHMGGVATSAAETVKMNVKRAEEFRDRYYESRHAGEGEVEEVLAPGFRTSILSSRRAILETLINEPYAMKSLAEEGTLSQALRTALFGTGWPLNTVKEWDEIHGNALILQLMRKAEENPELAGYLDHGLKGALALESEGIEPARHLTRDVANDILEKTFRRISSSSTLVEVFDLAPTSSERSRIDGIILSLNKRWTQVRKNVFGTTEGHSRFKRAHDWATESLLFKVH